MSFFVLNLNARLQPMHRGEIYEDVLIEILEKTGLGEVVGGGTLQAPSNEIISCDIEIEMNTDLEVGKEKLLEIIYKMGVPNGSFLVEDEENDIKTAVGRLEGLGLYLNGTDLDDEVYRNSDINFVVGKLEELVGSNGRMYSYMEGSTETALYFYGDSFEEMKNNIQEFVDTYPLCQKCRIEQIA